MVTTPSHSGYRTRLIGLLARKYSPGAFYAAKDADEAQALTRGLSKVGTRVKAASQQGWAGLLNGGGGGKLILSWMIYRRSFAISFSFVLRGGARSGQPFMMR